MFFELNSEVFRVLKEMDSGCFVISCQNYNIIQFIDIGILQHTERVAVPECFAVNAERLKQPSVALKDRMLLIQPLLEDEICLADRGRLTQLAKQVAAMEYTTKKRVLRLYYTYLATGSPMSKKLPTAQSRNNGIFDKAIRKHYFSAKQLSLKDTYQVMLLETYTTPDGKLIEHYPSWDCFKHYFYRNEYQNMLQKEIGRMGLSAYQRNSRPIFGAQSTWKERLGVFQMDATVADVYLVDSLGTHTVIGRPKIYMAVDTASRLIAGVYVTMEQGETEVLACLTNATANKVVFCEKYGIHIKPEQWPNTGLPKRIVVDRGEEFFGERMGELCAKYGVQVERLPPFRPDLKGLVEKSFDLLQQKYKPLLRGKGVVNKVPQERWDRDCREQARLSLSQFTAIVIRCVVYLNSARKLNNLLPEQADSEPTAAGLWDWCVRHERNDMLEVPVEEVFHIALPRKKASLTRTGLIYNKLRYINPDYKDACFVAGKTGYKSVRVAVNANNTSRIFLIESGAFIPFDLAPASKKFGEMTFAEYEKTKQDMRVQARKQENKELEAGAKLYQQIKQIVQDAGKDGSRYEVQ